MQQLLSMDALPSPLSSRAKPRDLRFSGPFVEMFFDRSFHGPSAHPRRLKAALMQPPRSTRALPSPLSSRAKPRDLRFSGPFVEMFFDRSAPGFPATQHRTHPRNATKFDRKSGER